MKIIIQDWSIFETIDYFDVILILKSGNNIFNLSRVQLSISWFCLKTQGHEIFLQVSLIEEIVEEL